MKELYCGTYNKCFNVHKPIRLILIVLTVIAAFLFTQHSQSPAFAEDYSLSMTTSGSVTVNVRPHTANIDSDSLNVITNCKAGYNLTMSTSVNDNNLYLSGNSSNNQAGTYLSPTDGTTILSSTTNAWGYSLAIPANPSPTPATIGDVFNPVPTKNSTPATLKTSTETHSSTSINDNFQVYYGTSISNTLASGTYQMINDTNSNPGVISYYLTASPDCANSLDLSFNQNLNGSGSETDDGTNVTNFPTTNDNTLDTTENTLTLSTKIPTRYDYLFAGWNTAADGTGQSFEPGAVIHIGPNTATGEINGIITLYAIWTVHKVYMQDFTYSDCKKLSLEENIRVYDRRDESKYTVARLQDNQCWMTSDLHLGSTASTMTLTSANTDIENDFTLPIAETSATKTQWGTSNSTENLDTAHIYKYNDSKYLYNWYTATAGTTYTSSTATTSICPKNWKLLTRTQAENYLSAISEAPNSTNTSILTDPPLSFTNGYYNSTTQTAYGNKVYWTANGFHSSSTGNYSGYFFGIGSSSGVNYVRTTYGYQKMMGLGIRCLLSPNVLSAYPVTVSLDSYTTSVTFTDQNNNVQTATAENPIVNLVDGKEYTIAASFASGYTIDTWSTSSSGTIGNPIVSTTTFTVTDSTTLSITSKQPSTFSSFTPSTCAAISAGDIIELTDPRDGVIYKISKLADGNCWMLDNLRLDLTDSTVKSNLTSSTTNASNTTLNYLKGTNTGTASDQYPTAAVSTSSTNSYSTPVINTDYQNTDSSVTHGEGSGKIGVFYNYCAASAGSYCYGNGTSYNGSPTSDPNTATLIDVTEDICPSGWRMPTSTVDGEYQTLYDEYDNEPTDFADALSIPLSGMINGSSISGEGTYGYFWSSTWNSTSNMHRLYVTSSSISASSNYYRNRSLPIRCILGSPGFSDVTVNLDSNTESVTFTNPVYGTVTATPQNNTITLRTGVEYTTTANIPVSYSLDEWQITGNGTISDATENPATIIINSNAIAIATTTQARNSYEITVNLDVHSHSVAFYNPLDTTKQIVNSDNNGDGTHTGTVTLYEGLQYILTGSFTTDYTLDHWTTTANGTLGSSTQSATTYSVTNTATLSLSSKAKIGSATLLPGTDFNAKIKTIAEGTSSNYNTSSSKIKALRTADPLPANFVISSDNIVSTSNSDYPVYAFFDNTNDTGIMYFYTEASKIYMNTDSHYALMNNTALIDISALADWDASRTTDFNGLFSHAKALSNISPVANWDTSSGTSFAAIFSDTYSLTNLNALANWDISNATRIDSAFTRAPLTDISGISNWDTSNVTNMSFIFNGDTYGRPLITNLDALTNWDVGNVTDMNNAFSGIRTLTDIDGLTNWDTSNTRNMISLFAETAITDVDALANWNTSSVTLMRNMFEEARSLNDIDGLKNWDTSNVTNIMDMFSNARSITDVDALANWDTSNVTNMDGLFNQTTQLRNIDGLKNWDTSKVTRLTSLFQSASSLTSIDALANWNTSKVTAMSLVFEGASSLTDIDILKYWDTSNVVYMNSLFRDATSITDISALTNWDTTSVINMAHMFDGATSLTNVSPLDNWDINSVIATANESTQYKNNFYQMFYNTGGSANSEYHPTFTQRSGTWNQEGTFIPGDTTTAVDTITIVFDNNISNVKIMGDFPDSTSIVTRTISTSGSTISLDRGYPYEIKITASTGYELDSWDPGNHGVIGFDGSSFITSEVDKLYFTSTGNSTLTATSQPAHVNTTTTVNMGSNVAKVVFTNKHYDNVATTTNGSTVTLKQGVAYKVIAVTTNGYEVSSWTATGGTISNNTGPHTYFTPSTSPSTITVSAATTTQTHTITVNMDSNVSYVTFTNNNYPTEVAIRNNSTVDLRDNTSYTVTAYTKDGYELSSWSTTNGTLGNNTQNPTTFTTTTNATITVTSQAITP